MQHGHARSDTSGIPAPSRDRGDHNGNGSEHHPVSNDTARDLYELHQRMRAAPSGDGASRWLHAAEGVSWPDLCAMHDTAYRQERALHSVIVDRLHAAGVETRGMLARALELRMGETWRLRRDKVGRNRVEWGDLANDADKYAAFCDGPFERCVQTAGDVTAVLTTGGGLAIFETRLRREPA